MHKTILTTALVTLGSLLCATTALGDHTLLRRNYELRRIDLEQDYKAKRDANKFAYRRERDALEAARRRANRIDCRDTRAIRVRAINRDLAALSRDYNATNRRISAWYRGEREALRNAYDVALRNARRRPVVVDTVIERAHPADCSCHACVPVEREVIVERPTFERPIVERRAVYSRPVPRPVIVDRTEFEPPAPLVRPRVHPAGCDCHICEPPVPVDTCPPRGRVDYGYGRGFAPGPYGRNAGTLDWAGLILNLLD